MQLKRVLFVVVVFMALLLASGDADRSRERGGYNSGRGGRYWGGNGRGWNNNGWRNNGWRNNGWDNNWGRSTGTTDTAAANGRVTMGPHLIQYYSNNRWW